MPAKRTLIRGGQIYDHDGDVHRPAVADILIAGDAIAAVGAGLAADGVDEIIDAAGRLIVPGLINAHYHSHDVLCSGLFEELPLEFWLLYTLPMGGNRSNEEVRARTLVGALESLRCGITTVQDMLGTKGRPIAEQLAYLEHQFKRHPAGGTLHWAIAPFAPQRCSPNMLQGCAELADKYDLAVYT